ncbi:hypothetical protein E4T56_gene16550 [Termitomyces sp. T112]|nr:hypothetical protein E4T56_gene16550 [Termitomyces sp. T112]
MALENHFPAGTGPCDAFALTELRSYVHVKKIPRHESNDKRTIRSPMAGRLIYASKSDMTMSVSYPGYLNVSIPFTTSDDDTLVAVIPRITSNTFQLPPLPYSSSLQLHSILSDIVTTSPAQWATSRPLSLQHITPKMENTSQNQQTAVFSFTPTAATRLAEPSPVMHPNNPYVPWTSEMRREYLRPSPSYSRCVDCGASKSSSIVLLSEPIASSVNHSRKLSKKEIRTHGSASNHILASPLIIFLLRLIQQSKELIVYWRMLSYVGEMTKHESFFLLLSDTTFLSSREVISSPITPSNLKPASDSPWPLYFNNVHTSYRVHQSSIFSDSPIETPFLSSSPSQPLSDPLSDI